MGSIRYRYLGLFVALFGAIIFFTFMETISGGIWAPKGCVSNCYSWFYGNSMEEIKQIPPWFWYVAIAIISIVLSGLVGVIIFFLTRYIKSNDSQWEKMTTKWSEMTTNLNTMVNTINLLGHRTNENEKDIDDINEKIARMGNLPFVKQRHKGG
jgi:hypothetical protein